MSTGWESEEGLRRLARSLPHPVPEPGRVASVRARVLDRAAAERRRARLRSGAFVAFALAALAVLAIGLRQPSRRDPVARYHGTITADSSARFRRASAAPDELVVLESGTIHVEVSPLGPGERFRVHAGDGEVEVRGTAFDVTVEGGHLAHVEVEHGRVDVRSAGSTAAKLGAGQHWEAASAAPAIDVPPSAAPVVEAPSAPPTRRTAPPSPRPSKNEIAEPEAVEIPSSIPPPSPSVVAPPSPSVVASPPRPAPAVTANPGAETPAPASTHDEERRERRDERRERHDQRRLR